MSQDEYVSPSLSQTTEDAPTPSARNDHYSTHHRKPRNVQGDDSPRNKSSVLRSKHDAWHILYEALPAPAIISLFEADQEIYGNWIPKSDIQRKINEAWANSSERKIKRRKAWYYLFEGKSLEEIVEEINSIWLDPDYQIMIGIERTKKVWIVESKK
jgi:hypothetical protein